MKRHEPNFCRRLASSSEEALKMEKKLQSAQKKLEKIEQDSGFMAFELEKEIKGIEEGERKSKDAKSELVEANLRLVVSIAKKVHEPGASVS